MLRLSLGLMFCGLVALAPAAPAAEVKLAPANTKVQFVCAHTGARPDPRTGTFGGLSGAAEIADGQLASIRLEIDTASLTTDIDRLTNHLKSPDFFDVRQHPKATFRTTKIEPASDGQWKITGELTLLGKTQSISFPAAVSTANGLSLKAEFAIDRTQFGMNYGLDRIEKQVNLTVTVSP